MMVWSNLYRYGVGISMSFYLDPLISCTLFSISSLGHFIPSISISSFSQLSWHIYIVQHSYMLKSRGIIARQRLVARYSNKKPKTNIKDNSYPQLGEK